MKKSTLTLIIFALFVSCGKINYRYAGIFISKSDTIEANKWSYIAYSDSEAYVLAYKHYVEEQNTPRTEKDSRLIGFKLYNGNDKNILNEIKFKGIDSLNKVLESEVLKDKYINIIKIDSAKIKELKKYFTFKKDEFSNEGITWVKPKDIPSCSNANALYCYFAIKDNTPQNLRFKLQYFASDWLFIKSIQFSIDEISAEYVPEKVERDNDDSGIWEWFDDGLNENSHIIITMLTNAKKAKMKLSGQQYYKVKDISGAQLASIKRTIDLYKSMGGGF